MTIDDELILELFKPDRYGKVGKDALIVKIVGKRAIYYNLEELHSFYLDTDAVIKKEKTHICPDILIYADITRIQPQIAIELENDIKWDFGESLRQVKKYKGKFSDTRVIIPEEYERFAPLYKNEGFRVYLWKATRVWQCMICGDLTYKEGPIPPKCEECNKHTQHRLVGLEDTDIEEYEKPSENFKMSR